MGSVSLPVFPYVTCNNITCSQGEPHGEAKKRPEQHFYVFPFLLGVRGRVFDVFVTPMRCFRPHVVAIFEVCVCFLAPEVFRPLLSSFSVYVITFRLWVFHGGNPAMRPKHLQNHFFTYSRSYWE